MSSDTLSLAIKALKSKKETLTNQLTNNSSDLRLDQRHGSSEIEDIKLKYGAEKDLIRNEIESLDGDNTSDEYAELMTELKELDSEEDDAKEEVETDMHYKEEDITLENTTLEVQIEAIDADIEAFETMRDEAIEDEFGYFQ